MNKMYLEVTVKDLKRKSVYEYIASSIESKFPDSKDDADKIRNALSDKEVESIFGDYFEGWIYDGVKFLFGDIKIITYWMDQEVQLYKKQLEYKKWVDWLAERGLTPEKLMKSKKQGS